MLYLTLSWFGYISCARPMFASWWRCFLYSCFFFFFSLWHFFCVNLTCVYIRFILTENDATVSWRNITIFQNSCLWNCCSTLSQTLRSWYLCDLEAESALHVFQDPTLHEKIGNSFILLWEEVRGNAGHWKVIQQF